ncbi:unnamed protein product [Caretta caretta]
MVKKRMGSCPLSRKIQQKDCELNERRKIGGITLDPSVIFVVQSYNHFCAYFKGLLIGFSNTCPPQSPPAIEAFGSPLHKCGKPEPDEEKEVRMMYNEMLRAHAASDHEHKTWRIYIATVKF